MLSTQDLSLPTIVLAFLAAGSSGLAQQSPASPPSPSPAGAPSAAIAIPGVPLGGGSTLVAGNLVTNGDFEVHTGTGCQSNLGNLTFDLTVATSAAFGGASELDVYDTACYGLPAHSGTTKVGLHAQDSTGLVDAFTLQLSSVVSAGETCTLSYWAHGVPDFDPQLGMIEIGISSTAGAFGTLVFTGTLTAHSVWQQFTSTFTSPTSGGFLSIRAAVPDSWTHVDEFALTVVGSSTFCAGDGSATACPCGNNSPSGSGAGCLNSLGSGGLLGAGGTASIVSDSFVLSGSGMTNAAALYFQGTNQLNGGLGFVFGDGLRCAGGTIIRLGTKVNAAGASQYPGAGDPSISVRGLVTAPGMRTYQVWYRNAAPFCSSSTFNLTNGLAIDWVN